MSEQVRNLFRRETEERSVRLLDSVYKFRSESVPEAKIDGLTGGETLASRPLTAPLQAFLSKKVLLSSMVFLPSDRVDREGRRSLSLFGSKYFS